MRLIKYSSCCIEEDENELLNLIDEFSKKRYGDAIDLSSFTTKQILSLLLNYISGLPDFILPYTICEEINNCSGTKTTKNIAIADVLWQLPSIHSSVLMRLCRIFFWIVDGISDDADRNTLAGEISFKLFDALFPLEKETCKNIDSERKLIIIQTIKELVLNYNTIAPSLAQRRQVEASINVKSC